jgi:hypothetical protein
MREGTRNENDQQQGKRDMQKERLVHEILSCGWKSSSLLTFFFASSCSWEQGHSMILDCLLMKWE